MIGYDLTLPYPVRAIKRGEGTKPCVYAIHCKARGRWYIGSTRGPSFRWSDHRRSLRLGTHQNPAMLRDYEILGDGAFEMYYIAAAPDDYTERRHVEQAYLTAAIAAGVPLYNVHTSAFGRSGMCASNETRNRMSAAQKGRTVSDETRQKMRDKKLGRKCSASHRAAMSAGRIAARRARCQP